MNLLKDDLIKYYELRNHQSDISPNIAVVCPTKEFTNKMAQLLKNIKYDIVRISEDKKEVRIFIGDIETTYINIQTIDDLHGRYFKKYLG